VTRRLVKLVLRSVAARVYGASTRFRAHLTGKVLIPMYHRVIPRSELATTFVQPGMYVTPETFERHLRFFMTHFKLLSFHELLEMWHQGSWDTTVRYCAITFDDGWLDNHLYAYPLLRAYRVPATIFLPTELIGTREWLWPDRLGDLLHRSRGATGILREALAPLTGQYPGLIAVSGRGATAAFDSLIEQAKTLPEQARDNLLDSLSQAPGLQVADGRRLLNWDEVREMSDHGVAFGSHTCTHADLTRLGRDQLQRELQQSLDILRRQRVNHVPVLAYPNGDYTDAIVAEARAAGYRAAVTAHPGLESSRPADLFRLKRIGVHDDVSRSVPLLTFHLARRARRATEIV